MKPKVTSLYSYALPAVLLLAGSLYLIQDGKKPEKPEGPPADPSAMMPKPSPEHQLLRKLVGTWDAVVSMKMDPSMPETKSPGFETNTMIGEFWVVEEVKGDFGGMPFQGHGMHGYSPTKKKYISMWNDSMGPDWELFEGEVKDGKLVMYGETPNPMAPGTMMKHRTVTEFKDDNTRTFTMYDTSGEKEMKVMWIDYKRKK